MEKKELVKNTYESLQKKRKKLKRNAILFASFLFVVNTYAWFVFIANANLDLEATVMSWDVKFFDEAYEEMTATIKVEDIHPGMEPFTKKIIVLNSSESPADFSYLIPKITLLGNESNFTQNVTVQDKVKLMLEQDYPFHIELKESKSHLESNGDRLEFMITVSWPYESTNPYAKMTPEFKYNKSIVYYALVGGTYVKDPTVTELTFPEKLASGLYVESDDADSYWGEMGSIYKNKNPELSCIDVQIKLKVTQVGS